jgi:hypothetical protein
MVKDAILKPLAAMAQGTRGYDLLCVLLGEDPISGEAHPPTAENLLGGFMKLIGQEEIWENIKKGNAIARAYAWFQGALGGLMAIVRAIPQKIVDTLTSLTFQDIITVAGAFGKIVGAFVNIAGDFIRWGLSTIWTLLQIIFDVVKPGLMGYIQKTGAALKSILKNPMPFLGNLVNAAKLGFTNFADRIGEHLKAGMIDWLTGSLEGVYIPKALTLLEFGKFALSILGISWAQIRGTFVKVLGPRGEMIMTGLEHAFDIIKALVTGGTAAAWEVIKDKLNDLKDQVISGIVSFVTDTIVKKAIPKIIGMFIPGAGFIPAIISIYDTIMVFVQKISKIIQVVTAFVDSIVTIAGGNIAAAANRVESVLGGLLSLAISFLAGFLGLGKVTDKIMAVVQQVRVKVDKAIDAAIAWIVAKAKALFSSLFSGKDKPDERTPEQKKADLARGIAEAQPLLTGKKYTSDEIRKKLPAIRSKYKITIFNLVTDAKSGSSETDHIHGEIHSIPVVTDGDAVQLEAEPDGDMVPFKIPRPDGFTAETAKALNPNDIDLRVAKLDRRHIISSKDMAEHYETTLLAQQKWSKAKALLVSKNETVGKPLSNDAIAATAKERHYRFFNDLKNLFLGPRGKNRSLGRRVDTGSDLPVPLLTEAGLKEHLQYVGDKWCLGPFQPTMQ